MGTPQYKIETPAATRIIQDLAPEEGLGDLRAIPFDQLVPGYYEVGVDNPEDLCPDLEWGCLELESVFAEFGERVNESEEQGELPDAEALLIVEEWQADLKKVTPRIIWNDPDDGNQKSYERHIFLHRDHNRDE
jgi:hypothetical protein